MRRMASASAGATDSTVSFGMRFSGAMQWQHRALARASSLRPQGSAIALLYLKFEPLTHGVLWRSACARGQGVHLR
jgi:hypothetical protein